MQGKIGIKMTVGIETVLREFAKILHNILTSPSMCPKFIFDFVYLKIPLKDTCGHQKVKLTFDPKTILLIACNYNALNIYC